MKNTTLCYIENEKGEYLMLHRVKKQNDLNHDKWIGVGGKCEEGESPEECVAVRRCGRGQSHLRAARDRGGDGADADGVPVPGRHHLRVRYLGGGVHAPVHGHRLDGRAAGVQ